MCTLPLPDKIECRAQYSSKLALFTSVMFVFIAIRIKSYSNDPLAFIIPNFMLFTPCLETTNIMWRYFVKHDGLPTYKKRHIPELFPMEDGRINYEELRIGKSFYYFS